MGWMVSRKPAGQTVSQYVESKCLRWNVAPAAQPVVVARCQKGGALFFAVRYPQAFFEGKAPFRGYVPALDGSVTGAVIVLVETGGGEVSYKDMDESMGPYQTGPGKAFLEQLSPLTDEPCTQFAKAWRARCYAALGMKAAA